MTDSDFDNIIYESFDHLDSPKQYFESKQLDFHIDPDEYVIGLEKSFERLHLPFLATTVENLILQNKFKKKLGSKISGHLFEMLDPKLRIYLSNLKEKHLSQQNDGLEVLTGFKTKYNQAPLGKIFDGLNNEKLRISPKRRADFINLFQGKELNNWKRIKWTGSNPELATLIFKLTGKDPKPALVNNYFDPKNNYDSNSHGGARTENHVIKQIIKNYT